MTSTTFCVAVITFTVWCCAMPCTAARMPPAAPRLPTAARASEGDECDSDDDCDGDLTCFLLVDAIPNICVDTSGTCSCDDPCPSGSQCSIVAPDLGLDTSASSCLPEVSLSLFSDFIEPLECDGSKQSSSETSDGDSEAESAGSEDAEGDDASSEDAEGDDADNGDDASSEEDDDGQGGSTSDPCIAVDMLTGFASHQLVFDKHALSRVLCDSFASCATRGHIVHYNGSAMMMKTYCDIVGCTAHVMHVNSPRYTRAMRIPSRSDGLQFTAFAARYVTRGEEAVLATAVRVGL